MRLLLGDDLPLELASALRGVADALSTGPRSALHRDVVAVAGNPDPLTLAAHDGPVVGVPLAGHLPATGAAGRAGALAVLDPGDLTDRSEARPVVLTGVPVPPPAAAAGPLDAPPGTEALTRMLADATPAPGTRGVTWLTGRGAAVVARAAAAWGSGRAAVGLPGVPATQALDLAGVPRCRGVLEATELTRVLLAAPPLVRVLAARGRTVNAGLPSPATVADGMLEAAELATAALVAASGRW